MKKLIALTISSLSFVSTYAHSAEQKEVTTLQCHNNKFARFSVALDPSTFEQNSGFYKIISASFVNGFYSAQNMSCEGNSVNALQCVGYLNGSNQLVEVITSEDDDGSVVAIAQMIRGEGLGAKHLNCEIVTE